MLKFFLGVAVVVFSTFCGYMFAKKYRKRRLFFAQMQHFNERFLNEITYAKRPLSEFANSLTYKGEFEIFSKAFLFELGSEDLIETAQAVLDEMSFFSGEEKAFIIDYFSSMGKGDSFTQKQYFSAIKMQLQEYAEQTKSAYEKYGNMYIKLGFLAGLTILILIV